MAWVATTPCRYHYPVLLLLLLHVLGCTLLQVDKREHYWNSLEASSQVHEL